MPVRKPNRYMISARVDIGCEREAMEDFVQYNELDAQTLLCVIADGTGSREGHPHPAAIATMEIIDTMQEFFDAVPESFLAEPCEYMRMAMKRANRVLEAFKAGNEELFFGYAASITCCLLDKDNGIHVAHCGNTRLYIIREGRLRLLTQDHTKAAELLQEGKIDEGTYYVHPDRLTLTSGIGMVVDPEIQTFEGHMKPLDLVLMTTDGIHYAIRPEPLAQLILSSDSAEDAVNNLITAAKNEVKYPDNMGAMIIYDRTRMQR